jgi:protease I
VCGGVFVNEPCVIDGNLFSGRTYHDNGHFVGPWIRRLEALRDTGAVERFSGCGAAWSSAAR